MVYHDVMQLAVKCNTPLSGLGEAVYAPVDSWTTASEIAGVLVQNM